MMAQLQKIWCFLQRKHERTTVHWQYDGAEQQATGDAQMLQR
jgi:hypothetical protein